MHYFYSSRIFKDQIHLLDQDIHHAINVLRLQPGDQVIILDGKGKKYHAQLVELNRQHGLLRVLDVMAESSESPQFNLYIAPTKRLDRMEWLVEKATEIGIASIQPIITRRSERKQLRIDRLLKKSIEAMKQSGNPFLPEIAEPISFLHAMDKNQTENTFIAYAENQIQKDFKTVLDPRKPVSLFIGPEGDFTPEEILVAQARNIEAVSLGKHRYRTETAALIGLMQYTWN
jgi:16S rRNA (uracil1498-N3)-methyltransferase